MTRPTTTFVLALAAIGSTLAALPALGEDRAGHSTLREARQRRCVCDHGACVH